MTDLSSLITRLEAATGADRELDRELWKLGGGTIRIVTSLGVNGRTPGRRQGYDHEGLPRDVPRYTRTLDASVALLKRVKPGWHALIDTRGPHARVYKGDGSIFSYGAVGANPALALLIALLRALQAESNNG